jgi:hypothetical protein
MTSNPAADPLEADQGVSKAEGPAKLGHRKVDPVTGEVAYKKVCLLYGVSFYESF